MTTAAPAVRASAKPAQLARPSWRASGRWSLARQYFVASLLVVVIGVVITGAWIGHQIEASVLDRTAGITALYVDSVLSSNLQALSQDDRWLRPVDTAALDRLVSQTGLGQGVVLFKIWSLDGRILYCPNQQLVGRQFPVDSGLARAAQGEVTAEMSDLQEPENIYEHQLYQRLVEIYAPVRQESGGRVIAVNEFYLLPDALESDIHDAQLRSWAVVAAIGLATYLLLAGIVKRGSDTISRQRAQLQQRLDQNELLHERVRQAAGRTTALNEQALRRISADLHDGPGQALALALLRLEGLQEPCIGHDACKHNGADFTTVHGAVRDALAEVRAISAGLRLPELETQSVAAVAERAIADHQRRSGVGVDARLTHLPEQAPLPIKIALLRTLQEALSNATRHGGGSGVAVELRCENASLHLVVSDHGGGFDPDRVESSGHLGLAGMRERAELLGGSFDVHSVLGQGTEVRVSWPLSMGTRA